MRRIEYKSANGLKQIGFFHWFSQDHQEFESGPGNYPVAIIECIDGEVILEYATNVKFIDGIVVGDSNGVE